MPTLKKAPGPVGHPLLGSLPAARKDALKLFLDAANEYGDLVRFRFGPRIAHLARSPEAVRLVVQERHEQYGKQTRGFEKIRLVLGDGLLTSEGSFWRRQRRIAQPAFHHKRIAAFGETMARCADELADEWADTAADTGKPIDVLTEMMRLTLRIVSITLLSEDTSARADEVGQAIGDLLHSANERMTRVFDPPMQLPTAENRRFRRNLSTLDDVILGVIAERRKSPREAGDLLSLFMDIRDEETGERMDDQQLRDEVMTVYIAGHETTANALTWTLMLLSRHPAEGRLVREELATVLGGRVPTFADLPKLVRTRAAIDESMRLYPPAWMIGRSVDREDVMDGCRIPKGTLMFISPYVSHRNPAYFPNPEGFDPARFLDGRAEKLPRFAYFPFGGGPRICIGNSFATAELVLVLATLWQRFQLDVLAGHDCTPEPSITLRPRHGMKMLVRSA